MDVVVDVLVVGAGPTGLAAAADLARQGVSVKIIDKNGARSDKSKALGVQAGTLEALSSSFGEDFSESLVKAGNPTQSANIHLFGSEPIAVDLSVIQSRVYFILNIPQNEKLPFLEGQLNSYSVNVDRHTELISLKQSKDNVVSLLKMADGTQTEITSDFVIGSDGAHSRVRKEIGVPFLGNAYSGDFVLGDVEMEWPWDYNSVRTFLTEKGFLACFPLDKEKHYRFIFAKKMKSEIQKFDITLEEFTNSVSEFCSEKIKIKKAMWLSRFTVSHRMTKKFQEGRVFLAGDGAHIHSPAGGQGMNTGIQDSLNLSSKLAQVLKNKAPLSILENYERERLPVAQNILRSTDIVTRIGLLPESPLSRFIRSHIAPKILRTKLIQSSVIKGISQVKIARKEIKARAELTP
jgi:3-(3-hydroxy-phenyl)propionate hydroxylase